MKKTIPLPIEFDADFTPPETFNCSVCIKCPLCHQFADDGILFEECTLIEYEFRNSIRDIKDFNCPIRKYFK